MPIIMLKYFYRYLIKKRIHNSFDIGLTPWFIVPSVGGSHMNRELKRKFWRYVLPSMFTMLLSGFYSIVDGLFVGNAIGNDALAAINIAYPIQVVINASALGIGIGGAVAMSSYRGKSLSEKEQQTVITTIGMLFLIGIFLSSILYISLPISLPFLGAEGAIYKGAFAYIQIILLGGLLPMLGNGLSPLLRNEGRTVVATACMSSGLITNILLDYIFVMKLGMGLSGAALATIIAQGVVAGSASLSLWITRFSSWNQSMLSISWPIVKQIICIGIAPFGQTLVPCIVIVLTNWMCLRYGGNDAVTVYSVVSYVLSSAQLLLQGIGDGVQPLLSYHHGRKETKINHQLYQKALFLTLITSVLLCISCFIFVDVLTALFGVSSAIYAETRTALLITALAFPFIGITRLTSAVFYAMEQNRNSTFLVYLEPCFLLPVCLLGFSSVFSLTGIWVAYPAAQICLCMCALLLKSPNLEMKVEQFSFSRQQ